MKRREFITLLGGSAVAWPPVARAQQPKMPAIGLLSGFSAGTPLVANFHQGLKESGIVEGQNVVIDYRSADGQYGRLPELAASLINKRVAVIVTLGDYAARAAKAAHVLAYNLTRVMNIVGIKPLLVAIRA
jgi:putative ABC transport system substrate-binding protein